MATTKTYTNRAKAFLFGLIAGLFYIIPLVITAIINGEKLFKDTGTSLTFFSVLLIIFFVIFAKKLVKKICGAVTIVGFTSIIMLVLSIAIKNIVDQLFIISVASVIGSVLAWLPTRIANEFFKNAKADNGDLRADLSVKQVLHNIFGFAV